MTRSMVRQRSAFTLIEMLVVIFLMSIIITLAVIMLPNLNRNKGVPNAANQLEGWIRLTKGQALRDGAPRGVRLIQDPNDPTHATALQYIEQPEPLAPRGAITRAFISTPNPNASLTPPQQPPYPNPMQTTVQLALIDPTTGLPVAPVAWDGVAAGDFFELTVAPYGVYQIQAVGGASNSILALVQAPLGRSVDGTDIAPLVLADGFRVIRAPRPLVGEPLAQMHKDVYIDLTWCYPCPYPFFDGMGNLIPSGAPPYGNNFTGYQPWSLSGGGMDILFNSNGQVAGAANGQIVLAVRHSERPRDMIFIAIYTRTGKVSAINMFDFGGTWSNINGIDYFQSSASPYSFGADGSSPGL
jgi:prepilin-type N-terminal cleavage/methylation domain-containing protein